MCQAAFENLKTVVMTPLLLEYPDREGKFFYLLTSVTPVLVVSFPKNKMDMRESLDISVKRYLKQRGTKMRETLGVVRSTFLQIFLKKKVPVRNRPYSENRHHNANACKVLKLLVKS